MLTLIPMTEPSPGLQALPSERPVVHIKEARHRYDLTHCQHWNVVVDAQLAELVCETCDAKLNPLDFLVRLAREEVRLLHQQQEINQQLATLEQRTRTKCTHCGRMTTIHT